MLMAAGVTAAVVVGAFVFWGPSGSYEFANHFIFCMSFQLEFRHIDIR